MSRPSGVQICLSPEYRAFKDTYVHTFMRSLVFPDHVFLNARHPLVRSYRFGNIDFWSGTSAWVSLLPRSSLKVKMEALCLKKSSALFLLSSLNLVDASYLQPQPSAPDIFAPKHFSRGRNYKLKWYFSINLASIY